MDSKFWSRSLPFLGEADANDANFELLEAAQGSLSIKVTG